MKPKEMATTVQTNENTLTFKKIPQHHSIERDGWRRSSRPFFTKILWTCYSFGNRTIGSGAVKDKCTTWFTKHATNTPLLLENNNTIAHLMIVNHHQVWIARKAHHTVQYEVLATLALHIERWHIKERHIVSQPVHCGRVGGPLFLGD